VDDPQIERTLNSLVSISVRGRDSFGKIDNSLAERQAELQVLSDSLDPGPALVQCPTGVATDPIESDPTVETDPCAVAEIIFSGYDDNNGCLFAGCEINVASVGTYSCSAMMDPVGNPNPDPGRCIYEGDPNFFVVLER
jgi:hypothetical protein